MKNQLNKIQGIISISSKGTGYVQVGEKKSKGEDPEIDFRHLNTAMHGDLVEIILHPLMSSLGSGRQTAEVSKIITRAKTRFTGVLEKELSSSSDLFFLKPDDTKMYTDILVPEKMLNGAKTNQKVFVEIISWKDPRKAPEGRVVKILGKPGDNDTEMHAIALERGFDSELGDKVENEAKKIKQHGINEKDLIGRKDFRKIITFTIDPYDAKDFDDAISFKIISDGLYEIGVHIADVSHYVKVGSELDNEARERGTSVYLVDRTIPMLPETLSNDLCSLVPNKDRLTMSAVFIIDKNARVKSEWFGRTIIHSQKRFTYEEAEKSIKNTNAPLHKELAILNNLAKKFTKQRFTEGALSLDQEEVKFILDTKGVPIKVIKKERGDSNRLIEEFMLLANRKVAEMMNKALKKDAGVFLYRIHGLPEKDRMADLAFFLRSLGYKISLVNGIIPSVEINKLLENLKGKNEKDTVHRAVIRSMAKAIYSTQNIGHYGLAFKHYTNFTSPIRRYPDILVHRFVNNYLSGKKTGKEELKNYEKITRIASEQEKRASEAERSSIKYKQVEYMSSRVGQSFNGIISGLTEWGLYVEEIETKCEGLVRVRDLTDDFYVFNEKKLELAGQGKKSRPKSGSRQGSGKIYRLGDRVKIKVKSVDLEKKTIDYVLV